MTVAQSPPRVSWRDWWSAAKTPRMLGALVLLVAAALVCVRLGDWQIDRAFERAEATRAAEELELAQADARPLSDLIAPGEHVLGSQVGLPATVTGHYDTERQLLVPDRVVDGERGYLVVTAFRATVAGDEAEEQVWLPVVRGFVTDPADARAPATGDVTLLGGLGVGEAYLPQNLPDGQISSVSPAYFANDWGLPIYNAYLVLAQADGDMTTVPRPEVDEGSGGLELRNLAYAIEWYVFGGFALFVWYRLVRDEARHRLEDAQAVTLGDESDEGTV